jgi:DNA gyrase/topoisomerase IV subunit B
MSPDQSEAIMTQFSTYSVTECNEESNSIRELLIEEAMDRNNQRQEKGHHEDKSVHQVDDEEPDFAEIQLSAASMGFLTEGSSAVVSAVVTTAAPLPSADAGVSIVEHFPSARGSEDIADNSPTSDRTSEVRRGLISLVSDSEFGKVPVYLKAQHTAAVSFSPLFLLVTLKSLNEIISKVNVLLSEKEAHGKSGENLTERDFQTFLGLGGKSMSVLLLLMQL